MSTYNVEAGYGLNSRVEYGRHVKIEGKRATIKTVNSQESAVQLRYNVLKF